MTDRIVFRLAVILYVASFVLPVEGRFFAGTIMLVMSTIGSIWLIPEAVSNIPGDPKSAFGLFMIIMPFYNLLFLMALTRFWESGRYRLSIFRFLLYACTVMSIVWAVMSVLKDPALFYVFGLWALAFLFLSLAVAIRTERNLAIYSSSLRS